MHQDDHLAPQEQRVRAHAKLFSVDHRQVVAYLNRDDSDALVVLLQLWVARTDEQLRVAVKSQSDALTQEIFDALNDEGISLVLAELGVPEMILAIEEAQS